MADNILPYQNPTTTDAKLDTTSLTVGANTVHRERIQIAGAGAAELADVKNANPATSAYGNVTRDVAVADVWDATNHTLAAGGNVAKGASDAGNPVKVGGVFNTTPTTLTTGQRGDLQLDSSQKVLVNATGNVAKGATDSGNPIKVGGVYNVTPTTLTDGQRGDLQLDSIQNLLVNLGLLLAGEDQANGVQAVISKPLAAATYSPSDDNQMTQVTKRTSKAGAGNVLSTYVSNANAAVRYFQIHNKATAPAGTDVPVLSFPIPAGTANNPGVLLLDQGFWTQGGKYLSTGVSWAVSTTYATFTDSATASDHVVDLKYV